MSFEIHVKRKREDCEDSIALDGASTAATVQSDIWYDDGNVILEAEKTQFRVHRGVLAKHSVAFREIHFPDHACPIVELSDRAEDLRYLLDALYEWSFRSQSSLSLTIVVSLIRLSRKYRVNKLVEELLPRLHEEWPSEYDAWIARARPNFQTIECDNQQFGLVQMLMVARTCKLDSLLPALYLNILSSFSLKQIETGVIIEDGRELIIPIEERLRITTGLIRLRYAFSTKGWAPLNPIPSQNCRALQQQSCFSAKLLLYDKEFKGLESLQGSLPSFYPMGLDISTKLCGTCFKTVADFNEGRKELWGALPSFFSLPPWEDLKKI